MEYSEIFDGGRLARIAARIAKDPRVLVMVKEATEDYAAGRVEDTVSDFPDSGLTVHASYERVRNEEVHAPAARDLETTTY